MLCSTLCKYHNSPGNPEYPIDQEKLVEASKDLGVVEINNSSLMERKELRKLQKNSQTGGSKGFTYRRRQ